tara:strand:- start:653 stop:1012 length:360 start_codon:yes stop_codon:yes gene_type:complete
VKYVVPLIILLSALYAQTIVGSWEMAARYTTKTDGKEQTLIRHLYHPDGGFESYIYHDGWFQFAGSGYYDVYKNRIRETVNYRTYSGKIEFVNDNTMTIQWDGDNKKMQFKRILLKLAL